MKLIFDTDMGNDITVEDDSATLFRPVKKGAGKHRFLIMSPEQASRRPRGHRAAQR